MINFYHKIYKFTSTDPVHPTLFILFIRLCSSYDNRESIPAAITVR